MSIEELFMLYIFLVLAALSGFVIGLWVSILINSLQARQWGESVCWAAVVIFFTFVFTALITMGVEEF
jgi:hypothetical protein